MSVQLVRVLFNSRATLIGISHILLPPFESEACRLSQSGPSSLVARAGSALAAFALKTRCVKADAAFHTINLVTDRTYIRIVPVVGPDEWPQAAGKQILS